MPRYCSPAGRSGPLPASNATQPAPTLAVSRAILPGLHEVVDSNDRPVCLLPEAVILRQGLCHRLVALVLRDTRGRVLLTPCESRAGGQEWGPSSLALPFAGEAREDCCRRLLTTDWSLEAARPWLKGVLAPCAESGTAFVALYEARIASALATALATPSPRLPGGAPLPDAEELAGLAANPDGPLSPLMRRAVLDGCFRAVRQGDA